MRLGERMKCSMFQGDCRFCSHEHSYIPYTPLVENKKTMRLEISATNIKMVLLGEWCNNISQWVRELRYCPARWGLHGVPSVGIRAEGCGEYSDEYGQSQITAQDDICLINDDGCGVLEI